jgi:hypothetical protein
MPSSALLYLFSSNFRPQYEQNILDVLGASIGARQRFRYETSVVAEAVQAVWSDLAGKPALVNYSLQQRAHYYDPVFIPVRLATVLDAFKRGDAWIIDFVIDGYISLPAPTFNQQGYLNLDENVKAYTDLLEAQRVPHPYGPSVSLGYDVTTDRRARLDTTSETVVLFERTAKYLQKTDSFRDARFLRFVQLRPEGSGGAGAVAPSEDGTFDLRSGTSYELELFQSQPGGIDAIESFDISVDPSVIQLVGRESVEIASDYDSIAVPFHTVEMSSLGRRETVLTIEPQSGVQGPRLQLSLRIHPPTGRLFAGAGATLLGLSLLGTASLLPISTIGQTFVVILAGVFVAALNVFGLFTPNVQAPNLDFLRGKSPGA